MKKNTWAKVMALFALLWILISIVWTWVLIIYDMYLSPKNTSEQKITQAQLEELMKNYSWSINSSWITINGSWAEVK